MSKTDPIFNYLSTSSSSLLSSSLTSLTEFSLSESRKLRCLRQINGFLILAGEALTDSQFSQILRGLSDHKADDPLFRLESLSIARKLGRGLSVESRIAAATGLVESGRGGPMRVLELLAENLKVQGKVEDGRRAFKMMAKLLRIGVVIERAVKEGEEEIALGGDRPEPVRPAGDRAARLACLFAFLGQESLVLGPEEAGPELLELLTDLRPLSEAAIDPRPFFGLSASRCSTEPQALLSASAASSLDAAFRRGGSPARALRLAAEILPLAPAAAPPRLETLASLAIAAVNNADPRRRFAALAAVDALPPEALKEAPPPVAAALFGKLLPEGLAWKPGKASAEVRRAALALGANLIAAGLAGSSEAINALQACVGPLKACLSDDWSAELRLAAVKFAHAAVVGAAQPPPSSLLEAFFEPLFDRLDDAQDPVRAEAALAISDLFAVDHSNALSNAKLEFAVKVLFVHLDDQNPLVQASVAKAVRTLVPKVPKLVFEAAEKAKGVFRTPEVLSQIYEDLNTH